MARMPDVEKVIYDLEQCLDDSIAAVVPADTVRDALVLLKAQEPLTDQDRKDLEILHKVRSGKVFKAGNNDYVIYNGEWYRNNPWSYPQEPVKPLKMAVDHVRKEPVVFSYECPNCATKMTNSPIWDVEDAK